MGLLDTAQPPQGAPQPAPPATPQPQAAPQTPAASQPGQAPMVDVKTAQAAASKKMDRVKRLVLAMQKMLYTPPSSKEFLKNISPDNLPQSVGEVASMVLTVMIDGQNEKSVPPDLVMPAGVTIVGDLLSYAKEVYGVEVDDALTQEAIQAFLDVMVQGVEKAQAGAAQQPPAAPQQPDPAAMPQPQGGMV